MATDVPEHRLVMLFIDGLSKLLHGWVKAFKPSSIHGVIIRTRDMEDVVTKSKVPSKPFLP